MKSLVKYSFVFVFVLGLTSYGFAQENANVNVSATVNASLQLTPSDIALGTIQTGSASTIDANTNDGATEQNLGAGASAGSLQIQGDSGADVIVTWSNATVDNGSDPLTFTPSVYNGATGLSSGASVSVTGGDITLDVGGTLAAPSGTGTYNTSTGSGSPIQFTVVYQ